MDIDIVCSLCGAELDVESSEQDYRNGNSIKIQGFCPECQKDYEDLQKEVDGYKDTVTDLDALLGSADESIDKLEARVKELEEFINHYIDDE